MDNSLTFAFLQIGSPWLLSGLLLCGVPLLIHFFFRRNYQRAPWAAMRFLVRAMASQSRRMRLESWLVLMLRCLLILLMVLAATEPALVTARTWFGAREPVHRILVIDLSLSMGAKGVGGTSYERAMQEVREIVKSAEVGDSFQVIRISGSSPRVIVRRPAHHADEVLEELGRWRLTEEFGDVVPSLTPVLELLAEAPESREVILVSDFQAANWSPGESRQAEEILGLLEQISRQAALTVIDVGAQGSDNVGIVSLSSTQPFAVTGGLLDVAAVVRNFGRSPVSPRLQWFLNGELQEVLPIELAANSALTVVWSPAVVGGADMEVSAQLATEDRLPLDDVRYLTRPVRDQLRLLLVDGTASVGDNVRSNGADFDGDQQRPMLTGGDFLQRALRRPGGGAIASNMGRMQFDVKAITDADLLDANLLESDVIWMCNVPRLDEAELRRLRQFVAQGGGLIVSMGDEVDVADYQRMLGTGEQPLLPVELDRLVTSDETSDELLAFDPVRRKHPLLRPFEGDDDGGLSTTYVFQYIKSRPRPDSLAQVVLRLSNGAPLLIEQPYGAGRVVVITTAADDRWGTWAVWPSFVPLVREISQFAASGLLVDEDLRVGVPLSRRLPFEACHGVTSLLATDGSRIVPILEPTEAGCLWNSPGLPRAGLYHLEFGLPTSTTRVPVAINIDPRESQLGSMGEADKVQALLNSPRHRQLTEWSDRRGGAAGSPGGANQGGLVEWLLGLAVIILLIEQLSAWKPIAGVWGLVLIGLLGLEYGLWRQSPWGAAAMFLLLGAMVLLRLARPVEASSASH
ncbi:MAG: BatA domain-containing protein [Planctomycetaceae bacterium]